MSESEIIGGSNGDVEERVEVRCYFVRRRNALMVRGAFESLYVDYYLHLMEQKIRPEA